MKTFGKLRIYTCELHVPYHNNFEHSFLLIGWTLSSKKQIHPGNMLVLLYWDCPSPYPPCRASVFGMTSKLVALFTEITRKTQCLRNTKCMKYNVTIPDIFVHNRNVAVKASEFNNYLFFDMTYITLLKKLYMDIITERPQFNDFVEITA